ncbi:heterokaryon incompatibility protein-domain-containing protein [Lineolata rhizophorae]|uniref:Heterokaryon incompatibility protein-domain-containing protein n=1 Tax=Lineolata rhizophorae TaxID=578093 RepID=A0A6A6P595_9PEZI|nr:heterokaryon incompatibility protein-domain-containing protein [Lineolata rhizophorae]
MPRPRASNRLLADTRVRPDTSEPLRRIRDQSQAPIYKSLLDIQECLTQKEQYGAWIESLECLYLDKSMSSSTCPGRKRRRTADRAVAQPEKKVLRRIAINPLENSDYIAVSYTWDPAHGEDATIGGYDVEDRVEWWRATRTKTRLASKVRDTVLDRVTKYSDYCSCTLFWIDKECIDQEDSDKKELAMQSMDLVYSKSRYPVALLSVRIETEEELTILSEVLRNGAGNVKSQGGMGQKTRKALRLLNRIASDKWWSRAWTFQEDYRASKRMTLLISHCPSLETRKQKTLGWPGRKPLFGTLYGELCISSVDFREKASQFCLAYQRQTKEHRGIRMCNNILSRAGKYTVLLSNTQPMAPIIFKDINDRQATCRSDLLAIAGNCCRYSNRLDATKLEEKGSSLSLCMLALYLMNGEIVMNNDKNGSSIAALKGNVLNFLAEQSLRFRPPVDESRKLTFIKSCRFINAKLLEEGISTIGHLWKLGKAINVNDIHICLSEQAPEDELEDYQRNCLDQLAEVLGSGWLGSRYSDVAKDIDGLVEDDSLWSLELEAPFRKRFMKLMAGEIVEAMRVGGTCLRLACLVGEDWGSAFSRYRGIFVSRLDGTDAAEYVFTSSQPADGEFDIDKHVSLEVEWKGSTIGAPRLFTELRPTSSRE